MIDIFFKMILTTRTRKLNLENIFLKNYHKLNRSFNFLYYSIYEN